MRDYVIPTTLACVAVRRLEVMVAGKNGARKGDTRADPLPSRVSLARSVLSSAHYLQAPATYAGYHYLKVVLRETIRNDDF